MTPRMPPITQTPVKVAGSGGHLRTLCLPVGLSNRILDLAGLHKRAGGDG